MQSIANIQSDALRANLEETAGEVVVDPVFDPLREVVADYQGLSAKLDHLLYEISHPYRNWLFILPEVRAFVLKNMAHYHRHEKGPECFALFCDIFLTALNDSQKNGKLVAMVMEAMLAYTDRLINSIDSKGLCRYQNQLNSFFKQLIVLDRLEGQVMLYMVQGHHPMKKMGYGNFPTKENCPENIEKHIERIIRIVRFDDLTPKGSHRSDT